MKHFIFLILLIFLIYPSFALTLDSIENGEYACYYDKRGGMNYYRIYCLWKIEQSGYAVFMKNIDLNTKESFNIIVELSEDKSGKVSIKNISGISKDEKTDVIRIIPDFLSFLFLFQNNKNRSDINYELEYNDDEAFSIITVNRILPLFGIQSIRVENTTEAVYWLDQAGIILDSNDIKTIYSKSPVITNERKRESTIPILSSESQKMVTLNGVVLFLDDNWSEYSENRINGYSIKKLSSRDSQISIELIPELLIRQNNFTSFSLMRRGILFDGSLVDFSTVKAKYDNEYFIVSYELIGDNGLRNIMYYKCKNVGNDIIILNFSSYYDFYTINKQYYDHIVNNTAF